MKELENKIPKGWGTATLDDLIVRISNGANVTQYDEEIGLPISRIETIWDGRIDLTRVKYIKECDKEFISKYKLHISDILFSHINSDSHLGKTAIYKDQAGCLIHGINLLLIRPSAEICSDYLNYQFQFLKYRGMFIDVAQRAVNQSSINQQKLKQFEFLIPPLNEQKRIVAKIEELFSELDNGLKSLKTAREQLKVYRQGVLKHAFEGKLTARWREKNKDKLESADQLLERIKCKRETYYRQQFVGWEKGEILVKPQKVAELEPICVEELQALLEIPKSWKYVRLAEIAAIGSGMSVSKDRKLNDPVEVAYLRVANVQRGRLLLNEIKTMYIERDKLAELVLKHSDILFNEGGDRDKLGRGWVWESPIQPCITQNHVFRATTVLGLDFHAKFISHWGNTFGQAYFDDQGKQTTNLASINKGVLSRFPVPLPPIEEQQQILEEIEWQLSVINQFETDIELAIDNSEALRQSILKKAFSGKLVPQDLNDEPANVLLERIRAEKEAQEMENKKPKAKRNAA